MPLLGKSDADTKMAEKVNFKNKPIKKEDKVKKEELAHKSERDRLK